MSLNTVKLNSYEKGTIIRKCTHGRPYGTDKVYKIYITYQYKCAHCSYKSSTWDIATRACLKIHSRHLHPLICGIFLPNSVNVARYASFIWQKSPTNCRIHLSESNFQTRSNPQYESSIIQKIRLCNIFPYFCPYFFIDNFVEGTHNGTIMITEINGGWAVELAAAWPQQEVCHV